MSSLPLYPVLSTDGLIAEQFCFKLCLILSNVSIFCEPGVKKQASEVLYACDKHVSRVYLFLLPLQILEAQLDVLKSLVQEFIGYLTQEDGKKFLCLV